MATRHIVSVKAVIPTDQGFILLKNDRDEWELPGGQLEAGEEPVDCVVREVKEELNIDVAVERLLATWQFQPVPDRNVLIVAHECKPTAQLESVRISHEHKAVGRFTIPELNSIKIPAGYARAISLTKKPVQ